MSRGNFRNFAASRFIVGHPSIPTPMPFCLLSAATAEIPSSYENAVCEGVKEADSLREFLPRLCLL